MLKFQKTCLQSDLEVQCANLSQSDKDDAIFVCLSQTFFKAKLLPPLLRRYKLAPLLQNNNKFSCKAKLLLHA